MQGPARTLYLSTPIQQPLTFSFNFFCGIFLVIYIYIMYILDVGGGWGPHHATFDPPRLNVPADWLTVALTCKCQLSLWRELDLT